VDGELAEPCRAEQRDRQKVNEAYERVLASDVRYRFVSDTATLG
jgi:D-arabinose 1-dehydrogenase-like Zn-dependent alcohol dehydrogenase